MGRLRGQGRDEFRFGLGGGDLEEKRGRSGGVRLWRNLGKSGLALVSLLKQAQKGHSEKRGTPKFKGQLERMLLFCVRLCGK